MAGTLRVDEIYSSTGTISLPPGQGLDLSDCKSSLSLPRGTTAQEGTPVASGLRFDTDAGEIKSYGQSWDRFEKTQSRILDRFPKAGLILYMDAADLDSYPLSGSRWYDLSGNNNTGIFGGSPTYNEEFDGYFNFNGSSDISRSASVTPNNDDFTIGFIYQLTGTGGRGGLFERKPSVPYNGFSLGQGGDGSWGFTVSGTSDFVNSIQMSFQYPTVNTWYFDVGVYSNGNTVTGYRNGYIVNSSTGASQGNLSTQGARTDLLIANRDNITALPCNVAMVFCYKRALNDVEIFTLYDIFKDRFGI
jgi:hypothetical protein